jgi:hypothetical protein
MQKFTDLLEKEEYQVKRVGIETKAYVERVNGDGDDDDNNGGGDNQGDQQQGGGELEP